MSSDSTPDVTRLPARASEGHRLPARASEGHREVLDELLPLIYDELKRTARAQRRRQYASETLNTTALVHEAYAKLVSQDDASWEDRRHFFRVASRAMRHILVDYSRRRRAGMRGGGQADVALEDAILVTDDRVEEVLAVDHALEKLAELDERQAQIVEHRYFTALTIPETADVMDISEATVKREWAAARAWLHRYISGTSPH